MLHVAGEHPTEQKTDDKDKDKEKSEKDKEEQARNAAHQGVAVLGIAAIVMAEEIGSQMALRAFDRILQVITFSYFT
jgi:26S proteasome regulatory subunit N1